ncbi:VOC family protein [Bacillus pacificus]|uniref:VOC family protein n=1 Tax=Bacillus pacificus TaxID=2026187 RepID=UPI0039812801
MIRFTNLLLIEELKETIKNHIAATIVIDDLNEVKELILNYNGVMITEPIQVPTGMKMIIRHPDGNIIEYIEPTLK